MSPRASNSSGITVERCPGADSRPGRSPNSPIFTEPTCVRLPASSMIRRVNIVRNWNQSSQLSWSKYAQSRASLGMAPLANRKYIADPGLLLLPRREHHIGNVLLNRKPIGPKGDIATRRTNIPMRNANGGYGGISGRSTADHRRRDMAPVRLQVGLRDGGWTVSAS